MKKIFILALAVFFTAGTVSAQQCTVEDFTNDPSGWDLSQGARITDYNNPLDQCSKNYGIITPGVGGNNPCNIQTPSYTSGGASEIQVSFDILVFNANMKCNTWKDFDCETSVDVFYIANGTKYTGIIDQVLPPNGPSGTHLVSFVMPVGTNLPAGTQYEIRLEFKPKSGTGHCVQQNTKYIIDNFKKCERGVQTTFTGMGTTDTKSSDFTVTVDPASDLNQIKITTKIAYDGIVLSDKSGTIVSTFSSNKYGLITAPDVAKGTYYVRLTKGDAVVSASKEVVFK
jgi:hypothetical protein